MESENGDVSSLKDFDFGGDYEDLENMDKDPVEYAKGQNEERIESEDPEVQKKGREIMNLQGALHQTFNTVNMAIGSALGEDDPLVRDDDEINNLAIVWGEYLGSEVGRDKIEQFIKQVPLVCAIGYTGVVYGSAVMEKIEQSNSSNQEMKLESPNE